MFWHAVLRLRDASLQACARQDQHRHGCPQWFSMWFCVSGKPACKRVQGRTSTHMVALNGLACGSATPGSQLAVGTQGRTNTTCMTQYLHIHLSAFTGYLQQMHGQRAQGIFGSSCLGPVQQHMYLGACSSAPSSRAYTKAVGLLVWHP
eukprot:1156973-Pelagomonas_calceolata.AAC.12